MFQKSLTILLTSIAYLSVSFCLTSSSLLAQESNIPGYTQKPTTLSSQAESNLIKNNPFVPQNNKFINKPQIPLGPQNINNKSKVLEKYLEFKSIAIINKKKYFSILNKRTNKSFWISENETVENFRVTNYNPLANTISITDGINTEIIQIASANETPLNVISATKEVNQQAETPQIPGVETNKNKEKSKAPPRRRVIPVKR